MGLKVTVHHMKQLISAMNRDLDKASRGNRAAAQRVRINSVRFAKIAKTYRKESVAEGKSQKRKKKMLRARRR